MKNNTVFPARLAVSAGRRLRPAAILKMLLAVSGLILLMIYPRPVMEGIKSALLLWWNTILPGLFPFFIATELMIPSGTMVLISQPLAPLARLMRCPDEAAGAFLLSLISGYPNGSKVTAELYNRGILDRRQACRLAFFTGVTGPGIFAALGAGLYNSPSFGWMLWVAHGFSALYTGWIFMAFPVASGGRLALAPSPLPISGKLPAILGRSVTAILTVGGYMAIFAAWTAIARSLGVVDLLREPLMAMLHLPAHLVEGILYGSMEMTTGLAAAAGSDPSPLTGAVLAGIVSFGGASVIAQMMGMLEPLSISGKRLVAGRCLQALLAALFAFCFLSGQFITGIVSLFLPLFIVSLLRVRDTKQVLRRSQQDGGLV